MPAKERYRPIARHASAVAALPAPAPRTSDDPARSVGGDEARAGAAARPVAAIPDKGMATPGEWDVAELLPDSAEPAAAVREPAEAAR